MTRSLLTVFVSLTVNFGIAQISSSVRFDSDVFANSNFDVKIYALKGGDSITVHSYYYKTKAFYISHDSVEGYVYSGNINSTWELSNLRSDAESAAIKGQYWVGMEKRDATRALGAPDNISATTGTWGTTETWIYGKRNLILLFEDDRLTAYRTESGR